jgi:hypothetical protein
VEAVVQAELEAEVVVAEVVVAAVPMVQVVEERKR